MPVVESLRSAAQVVLPKPGPLGGALVEETALITRWLSQPGVRIARATEGFASPVHSAGQWQGGRRPHEQRGWRLRLVAVRQPESDLGGCTPTGIRPGGCTPTGIRLGGCVATQAASRRSAAPESSASAARFSPSSQDGSHSAWLDSPAWATIASGGIEDDSVPHRVGGAGKHSACLAGVELRVPTHQFSHLRPLEAETQRVECEGVDGPGLHPPGWCWWSLWSVRPSRHHRAPPAHWLPRGEYSGHHFG